MNKERGTMKIIGITGGSGVGKTTVLGELEQFDTHIIDCDAVYHRLLESCLLYTSRCV